MELIMSHTKQKSKQKPSSIAGSISAAAEQTPSAEEMVVASQMLVRRNPVTATVTMFGIGVSLGVLVGVSIADAALAARAQRQPDGYGEQIYHALRKMAPASFNS